MYITGQRVELSIAFLTYNDPAFAQDTIQRLNGKPSRISPSVMKDIGNLLMRGLMECIMAKLSSGR